MIGDASLLLTLDASTYAGSVCVSRGGTVLAEATTPMRGEHEERLMPAVADALARAGVSIEAVDAIVCGAGPGSFTSLRIAASIAKGIAFARERPLFAVSSLALLVAATDATRAAGEYLAVLDALRGEVYAAACTVDESGELAQVGAVELMPIERLAVMEERDRLVVGAGHAIDAVPHARGVVRLASLLARSTPVPLDGWEPSYGRLAEAQVQWEAAHGRPLPVG